MICPKPPTPAAFDYIEWFKAFGWGFISFPVVIYVIRTFGKQIWADLKAIWAKLFAKTEAEVQVINTDIQAKL